VKLIRSWPLHPPPGRARVEDDTTRLLNEGYEYRGLRDFDDDILHLDWDMAVSKEDLVSFAGKAKQRSDEVRVAPYLIYPDTRPGLPKPTWSCRKYTADDRSQLRYISDGEETCHLFGFGMVYLPRDLIIGFTDTYPAGGRVLMDDNAFSTWHHAEVKAETALDWDVKPIHLNYLPGKMAL